MKITISKILNKTDLAESGSHGGLVVTKPIFLKKLGWIGILKIRMTEKFFQFITWITLQMEPRQMTE